MTSVEYLVRREVRRRVPFLLSCLRGLSAGAGIDRAEHCLQVATRARLAGAPPQIIVAALTHDVGHLIPHCDHAAVAADLLTPYVDGPVAELVRWHAHVGAGGAMPAGLEARNPWVRAFVEWDIVSWDPAWGWDDISTYSAELDAVFLGGSGTKQRQGLSR